MFGNKEFTELSLYLQEFGSLPLLKCQEELDLIACAQKGTKAAKRLENIRFAHLSRAAADRLLKIAKAGESARNVLIERNLRLVIHIAKKFLGRSHNFELLDLVGEGNLGLLHAIGMFDKNQKCRLSTYATWWIRQSIQRALNGQGRMIRVPSHIMRKLWKYQAIKRRLEDATGCEPTCAEIAREMNLNLEEAEHLGKISLGIISLEALTSEEVSKPFCDLFADKKQKLPEDLVETNFLPEMFQEAFKGLTAKQRRIITLRFGLEDGKSRTLSQIAEVMGISKERVRQIQVLVFKKLRSHETIRNFRPNDWKEN